MGCPTDVMLKALLAQSRFYPEIEEVFTTTDDPGLQAERLRDFCREKLLLHSELTLNRIQRTILEEVFEQVSWYPLGLHLREKLRSERLLAEKISERRTTATWVRPTVRATAGPRARKGSGIIYL